MSSSIRSDSSASVSSLSVAGRVMSQIQSMILTGELLPGQSLVQSDLAERLGVSRVPVQRPLRPWRWNRSLLIVTTSDTASHDSISLICIRYTSSAGSLKTICSLV